MACLLLNGYAKAETEYWGNKAYRGDTSWIVPTNMNVGEWYCQKHEFYKTGTVINITFPLQYSGSCNATFIVNPDLTTYNPSYQQFFINKDLTSNTALFTNFTVSKDQDAFFCVKENTGGCQIVMGGDLETESTNYTANWYSAHQTGDAEDVNADYEAGIWNGASFPLSTRIDWTSNSIPEYAVGGGYIYSDGTGNMYPSPGVFRTVSSGQEGMDFYFDENGKVVQELALHMKRGVGGDGVGIRVSLKESGGSVIANCTFNQSQLDSGTQFGNIHYCNVSGQNATMYVGFYEIYAECFDDETYTTSCDGVSEYIRIPTSRTPDGVVVGEHIDWASWQEDFGHGSSATYEDVVFLLGFSGIECDDGSDNDGDGFIDYPDDPSCSSASDDSESPFDYVQCNNGLDDDGDGFIDYPDDPSCSNSTDTTESPRDDSPAEEDACTVEEGCLMKDTFPYSDELNLHGWENTIGSVTIVDIYGSNKMYFDTDADTTRFNLTKNITNPNIYDSVNSDVDFYIDVGTDGVLSDDTVYSFYWDHLDSEDRLVNSIRFNVSRQSASVTDKVKVEIYNYNGSDYVKIGSTLLLDNDNLGRLQFFLSFDQILKTYDMELLSWSQAGVMEYSDLPWANVLSSKIYKTRVRDVNSIDETKVAVYADDFSLYTDDISYDTVCTEWDLPYFLREEFNGYPMVCDWSANLNIFFNGEYKLFDTTSLYQQFKELPVHAKDENIRYVGMEFDAQINSFGTDGSTYVRLYDEDYELFLTLLLYEGSGDIILAYQDSGTNTVAHTGIPFNESFNYVVIIDFESDTYDIYFNGSLVKSSADFYKDNYNLQEIGFARIGSTLSNVELDNFEIYGSDEEGGKVVPDDEDSKVSPVDTTTSLCGIVHRTQPSCTEDDDCDSGYCLPHGKCARWDANYCAENEMAYGNKCFFAGTLECGLTSATNAIINNIFLFMGLLVLIMLAVYLVIFFTRGRG